MYKVDCRPDASVKCPRRAERSASSVRRRSLSGICVADVSGAGDAGQSIGREAGARVGLGLLSRFIGAVFLVLLGGLLLLDRALQRANYNQAKRQADTDKALYDLGVISGLAYKTSKEKSDELTTRNDLQNPDRSIRGQ